jgi:flagellar hook assembly protein FlgD
MQVNSALTAPLDPSLQAGAPAATAPSNPTDKLANESTFLQLLVAQIQNQDPLNPTDSIQFVGQLVQFSQLEQLIGIKDGVMSLKPPAPPTPPTPPTPAAGTPTAASLIKE